jgi:hypothetical protein
MLHHQILRPSLGWTANYHHAYSLRRILRNDIQDGGDFLQKAFRKNELYEQECWIGSNRSISIDVFFQPLYIGGALADDRESLLGDLVYSQKVDDGLFDFQYVHDFGCWWSHSIRIEPCACEPPSGGVVAFLVSGKGPCPVEDTGGRTGGSKPPWPKCLDW